MSRALEPSMTVLQYFVLLHQRSYTEFCREVGLTPQQFNDWVKKRRPVPQDRLLRVAQHLRIEPGMLIDERQYLNDLTPENKVRMKIVFIRQMLEQGKEGEEAEAYAGKLEQLEKELRKQTLLTQFAALLEQSDEEMISRYEQWLRTADPALQELPPFAKEDHQ